MSCFMVLWNRGVLRIVSNRKKLTTLNKLVSANKEWWDQTIRDTRMQRTVRLIVAYLVNFDIVRCLDGE
jgi:hypothetical protein